MSWHLAAPWMLWGLLGLAIPVVIHLLNRRRVEVVDWGAMQFLELGERARRRFQVTELLLMAVRMCILGLVALAVTRPYWEPKPSSARATAPSLAGAVSRDVVLVLDQSASMSRRAGGVTPYEDAIAWARNFVSQMRPGDSAAILLASDRVRPLVGSPSFDKAYLGGMLKNPPKPIGASDLPAALADALRILESTNNPAREVIILTDGQRIAWRPAETKRWDLLRALHKQSGARAPRIWAIAFGSTVNHPSADGSVGPIELTRHLVAPGLPIAIAATVSNAGPEAQTRTAELLVDDKPIVGSAQVVGPIPAGGKTRVAFQTSITEPGSHLLNVRLSPADDPLEANDSADQAIAVAKSLPVLLVDGEPGAEPLSNETDFLRAALAPKGDETPAVQARVITPSELSAETLAGQRVVVLANVERLNELQSNAIAAFLDAGNGVLVALGDQVDAQYYNDIFFNKGVGWLPARIGPRRAGSAGGAALARPVPRGFTGPALAPFGQGESPALGAAKVFEYRVLEPTEAKENPPAVIARLDTGDPWIVERPRAKGRVIMLASPIDAEGGTLPVNPDFVPWAHELVYYLADGGDRAASIRPGEAIAVELPESPPEQVRSVRVKTPSGETRSAPVVRDGERSRIELSEAREPGAYRFELPAPQSGTAYVTVAADAREWDPEQLATAEAEQLARGWPLVIERDSARVAAAMNGGNATGPRPIWRLLVLAALGGLCVEVWMTRALTRERGVFAAAEESS